MSLLILRLTTSRLLTTFLRARRCDFFFRASALNRKTGDGDIVAFRSPIETCHFGKLSFDRRNICPEIRYSRVIPWSDRNQSQYLRTILRVPELEKKRENVQYLNINKLKSRRALMSNGSHGTVCPMNLSIE
jgi:hypothetical protein